MATTTPFYPLIFLILLIYSPTTTADPYFSKTTLFSDHNYMLSNLQIFIYPPPLPTNYVNLSETLPQPLSLFYTSLLTSRFLTRNPSRATLFFLPFPPLSTRSLSRHIQFIRTNYPFWNRSLGADHFYLTRHGVGPASSRNVVELLKNAVQVTCFPSSAREFVPHKDVTLPQYFPTLTSPSAEQSFVTSTRYLGYASEELIKGLKNDIDFLIESEPSDEVYLENSKNSKFCLFNYEVEGITRLGVALAQGCVPVVITNRPIQDFPLMDIIRWSEIALFVGSNMGADEIKRVLNSASEEVGRYEKMRGLGMAVAQHMMWNSESSQPLDAFEMGVYQLWLRRHAIRYTQWEGGIQSH